MKKPVDNLTGKLISFGLSKKEASVYIALLTIDRGTVAQTSRKANVNRATTYVILDSLINKGLASMSGKKPKQEYYAESPDKLATYLEKQAEESTRAAEKAKEFASELKLIQKSATRPQIKFYEGIEGLRYVFEDSLKAESDNIIAFSSIEDQHSVIKGYFPEYYRRRAKRKLFMRAIFPQTSMGIERAKKDPEEYRESVFVPADQFGFHPAINVYDNKVMIASWREKLGIIIESAEIADAMKKIFELAWAEAKRLDKQSGLGAKSEAGV